MGDMSKIERPLTPVERAAIGSGSQMMGALSDGVRTEAERQKAEHRAYQSELAEAMKDNVVGEVPDSLGDRLRDAENLWRFFCRRDEMNAEVHLKEPHVCQCGHAHTGSTDGEDVGCPTCRDDHEWTPGTKVRYSPIAIASERVAGYLARLFYGRDVDYRTTQVETGGARVSVSYLHKRLDAQTEMLEAAEAMHRAVTRERRGVADPSNPFALDEGPALIVQAVDRYEEARRRSRGE